jgi:hypothetical protein
MEEKNYTCNKENENCNEEKNFDDNFDELMNSASDQGKKTQNKENL